MSGETRRPWSAEEDQAIKAIVKQLGTKRWSDISQAMQDMFQLFGRSGKQCRQRWHNHLAPEVNKRPWSKEEQQTLFEAHKKHGNKWTQISKLIEGRTDNAIKNHFYSSIRRSLRRINKILGSKNSTVKMRNVKPAVLSAIFNMADQQEGSSSQDYKDLTLALIQFSRNRVKKQKNVSNQQKTGLENLIKRLMQFNDVYEKQKRINRFNAFGSELSKINSENSNQSKKQSIEEQEIDQNEEQQIDYQDACKAEPSIAAEQFSQHPEPSNGKHINLEQSEYDWQKFQLRCETIVNRYLVSQCSLKSMEHIVVQEVNNSESTENISKTQVTPAKSEKQSSCSSRESRLNQRKQNTL